MNEENAMRLAKNYETFARICRTFVCQDKCTSVTFHKGNNNFNVTGLGDAHADIVKKFLVELTDLTQRRIDELNAGGDGVIIGVGLIFGAGGVGCALRQFGFALEVGSQPERNRLGHIGVEL